MTDQRLMQTDAEGVKDFRDIRAQHRLRTGQAIANGEAPGKSVRVAEIVFVPEEGDDFTEFVTRLVKQDVDEFVQVRDIETATLNGGRPLLLKAGGHSILIGSGLELDVQLTEDLDPATAFDDGPATATANVLVKDPDTGDLIKLVYDSSDVQVTVTNRFEHWDTIPANTFGWVKLRNDEWRPGDFDCDAAAGGLLS